MQQKKRVPSKRLQLVASYLPVAAHFADIGSDHAYLPCFVCERDPEAMAIAGEVNVGPFQSAESTIAINGLGQQIQVRLGDGLAVLKPEDQVKQIVIAGMGGGLITSILETGKDKLKTVERLILQPNVNAREVRKWLVQNGYTLINEEIMAENGHIYEILVAEHHAGGNEDLTDKALFFGPFLLAEQSSIFVEKWTHEKSKAEHVLTQMRQAKDVDEEKIAAYERELAWMKEVLEK